MEYKVKYTPRNGFTKIASLGDGELKLSEFGMIVLDDKETFEANSGDFEVALVILQGHCDVTGDGFSYTDLGRRTSVFDGKPFAVYIPRHRNYTVTARGHVEVAWADSPTDKDFQPFVVRPEEVRDATMSAGTACERVAYHIITDNNPLAAAILGEKLGLKQLEVERDGSIRLYEGFDDMVTISRTLFENGVTPTTLCMNEANLERYYMNMVGDANVEHNKSAELSDKK